MTDSKVCLGCKLDKSLDDYHKRSKAKDGRQSVCKQCNCEQRKAYYKTANGRGKDVVNSKRSKIRLRLRAIAYLQAHPCVDCGESDPIVLEFDHRIPEQKLDCISNLVSRGVAYATLDAEMDKCDVRCANCHKRRTARQFNWRKARLAQWKSTGPTNRVVIGSNPIVGTAQKCAMVVVAHLVERWTVTPKVTGSKPVYHPQCEGITQSSFIEGIMVSSHFLPVTRWTGSGL